MAVCPKCKHEYRDGFVTCTECQCDLVEELSSEEMIKDSFDESQEELYNKAFNGINNAENSGGLIKEEVENKPTESLSGAYRNSAQRAEDNKSSAWTLLFVGGVGFIGMLLIMMGIIPIHFSGMTKYMVYGVMLAMFLLFIIMGIVSLRNSKIFAQKAQSENSLADTMRTWCMENLNKNSIDMELFSVEEQTLTEEIKYFKRIENLKIRISEKFMNLDEGFLDAFIDSIYEEIFITESE